MKWQEMSRELADAFLKYSGHKSTCRHYGGYDCNCGLDELRALCRAVIKA